MNEITNDPRVETIETTSRDDGRPGDHITWEETDTLGDVTRSVRREGIAHHRDPAGDWCTEGDMHITDGEGPGITITIRRPVQEPPTRDGTVIVTADGHKRIESVNSEHAYYAREAVLSNGVWRAAWRTDMGAIRTALLPAQIAPGSWKVDDQ